MHERPNLDLQRQEVVVLEKEGARAIQLGDAELSSGGYTATTSARFCLTGKRLIRRGGSPKCEHQTSDMSRLQLRIFCVLAVPGYRRRNKYVVNKKARCSEGKPTSNQMHAALYTFIYTRAGDIAW